MVKVRPGSRKGQTKTTTSGYNIARKRAGRITKRAHQQQYVIHAAMRETWDQSLNASGNLRRLGLRTNVNQVEKRNDSTIRVMSLSKANANVEQGMDEQGKKVRRKLEDHAGMVERGTKQVVRPGERLALQGMAEKYGEDYLKMSKDIKMNYLQWTSGQLKKKIERMRRILGE